MTDVGLNYINVQHPEAIYKAMIYQCNGIAWIENAFKMAWDSYQTDDWKYDGATFVREFEGNFWEVAAFIHDWLNVSGYVGRPIDRYFVKIMVHLQYPEGLILERCKWMQWTWLNVLNHKYIKRDFVSRELPNILK